MNKQLKWVIYTGIICAIGLVLLKFVPMKVFGNEILFDASMHFVVIGFCLYVLWFFVDQNKNWKIPYIVFAIAVLLFVSLHRIITNNHNDWGILFGLIILTLGIFIPRWKGVIRGLEW
jgi:hypothetical protein